jgi:hypothetical protein
MLLEAGNGLYLNLEGYPIYWISKFLVICERTGEAQKKTRQNTSGLAIFFKFILFIDFQEI